MKRLAIAIAVAMQASAAFAADPVFGLWQTQPDDGAFAHVQMSECGDAVCGVISRTFNSDGEYQSKNIGRQIVIDMVPTGEGNYKGRVWRPSNNKVYNGKIALNGDRLNLSGCIAGGLLCSKQTWLRVQ